MRRSATVLASIGASLVLGIVLAPEASASAGPGGPANCTGYSASNYHGSIDEFARLPHPGGPSGVGELSRTSCGTR